MFSFIGLFIAVEGYKENGATKRESIESWLENESQEGKVNILHSTYTKIQFHIKSKVTCVMI